MKFMCWLRDEFDWGSGRWYAFYKCRFAELAMCQLKEMDAPLCPGKCHE